MGVGIDPHVASAFSVVSMSTPIPNSTQERISQFDAAITHPDRDVRLRAAMDAGSLHDARVTDILVSRIPVEDDFHVRENITWALVQHGERAMPAVLTLLTSENPIERRQAAHILSKVGDPAHVEEILPVVADEDPDVAIKAYRAAASTGSPDVVKPLVARLGDGEGEQRDALSNALQQLGSLAVEALVPVLQHENADVRTHAAEALAQIGEDAQPAAFALSGITTDEDPEVALTAVMALGAVGGDAAHAALQEIEDAGRQPLNAVARRLLSRRLAI